MQIVVKNGMVFATHPDSQDVASLYPGCLVLTVPDGTALEIGQACEVSLANFQEAVCSRVNAARDAIEYGIFTSTAGIRYDVDAKAREKMTGLTAMLGATGMALPAGFTWTDADNVERAHDAESFLGLTSEILTWTDAVHRAAVVAKTAIRAAGDEAAVLAAEAGVVWP